MIAANGAAVIAGKGGAMIAVVATRASGVVTENTAAITTITKT